MAENKNEEAKMLTLSESDVVHICCAYAAEADSRNFTATLATMITYFAEHHGVDKLEWVNHFRDFMEFANEMDKCLGIKTEPEVNERVEIDKSGKVTKFKYRKDK